jgi:O-antigen ligase
MYGPGIFQDPNDVCVIIVTAAILLGSFLSDRRLGAGRWFWLLPLGIFACGFVLTGSRGGLLALVAGAGIFIRLVFGWKIAIVLGVIGLPALLGVLGSRQAGVSLAALTGQERIYLWTDGIAMFRANPIFGVGRENFTSGARQVAHNTYIHTFAELGFFGGALFVGSVCLAIVGLYRLAQPARGLRGVLIPRVILDPELRRLHPYVCGAVVAYAVGMCTLSMGTLATTYTFLGLASMYLAVARTQPTTPALRFDVGLVIRLGVLGLAYLVALFVFIRLAGRF